MTSLSMNKYTYYISLLFLACLGMVSCTERELEEIDDSQHIELTVSCINLNTTRADGDAATTQRGEDAYNENKINTIHYFLYQAGKTNENAVMKGCFENITETQNDIYKLKIPMLEGELNTNVFPIPVEECEVYLIANLPANAGGSYNIPTNTDLASLKAMTINTVFQEANPKSGEEFTEQSSFVMDGLGKAKIVKRTEITAAKGEIQLDRLAAKMTVRISVDETFTDTNGKTYTSNIQGMQVHLVKASNNTTLEGALGVANFDYKARGKKGSQTVEKKVIDETTQQETVVTKEMCVFEPFYSYPLSWEYKDNDALVLHITVPWKEDGKERYETCHYKVFPSTLQLDRNNWYNIDLHIGVLGSFDNEEKYWPEITGEYKVLNWNNGTKNWGIGLEIDTDILGARYLVVEQNEYVVNNKNTFEIPFISSHKCIIKDYKVTKKIFVKNGEPVNEDQDITSQANNWISIEGNTIKLNHALNNDFINTSNYDYTPYEFSFYICHQDKEQFQEKITIIQKPALTVTAQINSYDHPGQNYCGYVFVNGHAPKVSVENKYPNYGGVDGRRTSQYNTNPYMYTIEVTVLPAGSDYIIGDPRVPYTIGVDLDASSKFYPAIPLEGGTARTLTNYYGTSKDASKENMIAPKFRVCSAHGWCSGDRISYKDAFNRAASYQEDGYPAGRWRVPTKAEIQFVNKLNTDGLIPGLFYGSYAYWCTTGSINGTTFDDDLTKENVLRSVYDDWYWEHSDCFRLDESKRGTFTWGDEVE